MDLILAVLAIAVVAVGAYWWFGRRRTPPPEEDEWVLPTEDGRRVPTTTPGAPRLDRDSLLHRDRAFDPSNWDDSPDAEPTAVDEDAAAAGDDPPTYFGRDSLRRGQDETEG